MAVGNPLLCTAPGGGDQVKSHGGAVSVNMHRVVFSFPDDPGQAVHISWELFPAGGQWMNLPDFLKSPRFLMYRQKVSMPQRLLQASNTSLDGLAQFVRSGYR